jgi:hypothetical protein
MVALRMPQSIFEGINRRADYVMSLTDPTRTDPSGPDFFLDVIEGLRSCALLRDYLTEALKLVWKEVFDNKIEDYNTTGNFCLAGFNVILRTYEAIRHRAEGVKASATQQDVAPQFGEAVIAFEKATADVQAIREEFQHRWPWLDENKYQQSLTEERRTLKRRSVKEVHDELRRRLR